MSDHKGIGWIYLGQGVGMGVLVVACAVSWVLVMNTYSIGSAIAHWIGGGP